MFLQTSIRPNALQKALEKNIPNTEVVVYGRYRDFEKGLDRRRPDAVIAIRPVLEAKNLTVSLKGVLGKVDEISYVIITNGAGIVLGTLSEKTVGVVDILGRKRMGEYVSKIINTAKKPKLKLVTRNEDLLPLLQLNLADAILLPKHEGEKLRAKSNLNLNMTVLRLKMGLPSVSCITGNGREICNRIEAMSRNLNKQMGVDQWTK